VFERGYAIVISSIGPEVREVIGCTGPDARRVLRLVAAHQDALTEEWRRFHG